MINVFATLILPEYEYKVKPIKKEEFGINKQWDGMNVRTFYRGFEFKDVHRIEKIIVNALKKRNASTEPRYAFTQYSDRTIHADIGEGYSANFEDMQSLIKNLKIFA